MKRRVATAGEAAAFCLSVANCQLKASHGSTKGQIPMQQLVERNAG